MRRVLLILLLCAVVVAAAWFVAGLPGQVAIQVRDLSFEASVPVAILVAVAVFIVLYALLRLLAGLIGTPARMRRARARRHRRLGDIAVTRTLVALAAGEGADARREARRARRFLGDTPQTLLLAAEAGRAAGRPEEADTAFLALSERDDAAFLGLRGLLRDAVTAQDWDRAADLARRAEIAHPGAAWLREERWHLAIRTRDWQSALSLAPAGAPIASIATAAAAESKDSSSGMRLARRAWEADRGHTQAALAYAGRLRDAGKEAKAQDVLRRAWEIVPQPELATFALAKTVDPKDRVRVAERLVNGKPGHVESQLLLGRLALEAGLIAQARRHADLARQGVNQRRAWMLLADVEEAEGGETEEGRLAQRRALRNAATAGADPSWRCAACGTVHDQWLPVCPSCNTLGRIGWTVTPAPAMLLPADAG